MSLIKNETIKTSIAHSSWWHLACCDVSGRTPRFVSYHFKILFGALLQNVVLVTVWWVWRLIKFVKNLSRLKHKFFLHSPVFVENLKPYCLFCPQSGSSGLSYSNRISTRHKFFLLLIKLPVLKEKPAGLKQKLAAERLRDLVCYVQSCDVLFWNFLSSGSVISLCPAKTL